MDLGLVAGLVMLVGWAIATFVFSGPGWVHLFLSLGVFLVIWRISARSEKAGGDTAGTSGPDSRSGKHTSPRRRSKSAPAPVPLIRPPKP
jgi:hypothetical protein